MEHAGGESDPLMVTYPALWLSSQLEPVFKLLPSGSKEDTTTLHVLGLLKELMATFPLGVVKSCCETLLRVMTLSHVVRTKTFTNAAKTKFIF